MNSTDSAVCKTHPDCRRIAPVNYCAGVDGWTTPRLCRKPARWLVTGPGRGHRYCTRHAAQLVRPEPAQGADESPVVETHREFPRSVVPVRPRADASLWRLCCEGLEPAEALPRRDREDLVWHLASDLDWSDREIAQHTRMTVYTTARIRARLGLKANESREGAAA